MKFGMGGSALKFVENFHISLYWSTVIPTIRGLKLTTHLHLAPSLRTRGAIPPLPHKFSWRDT